MAEQTLYADLTELDQELLRYARRLWRRVNPGRVQQGLTGIVLPALMPVVTQAQMSAVDAATKQLDAWDSDADALDPTAFAGYAPNGAPLAEVAVGGAITAMSMLRRGETPARAMRSGALVLERDLVTAVHDTGRQALQVGIVGNKVWTKYRRYVEPGACSRCIILAGVEYRWSEGFDRHPKCRCHHEPVTEDAPESRSPREIFDSMSRAEQDRIFTPASAAAIRDGADMNQIVNARRGMTTVSVGGVDVKATTEGTTRRGYFSQQRRRMDAEAGVKTDETTTNKGRRGARENYRERRIAKPRLLPEEIYKQAAGDRDEAIRLLHANGYYVAQ